jgi:import inner membrane translocase subunit TIM9
MSETNVRRSFHSVLFIIGKHNIRRMNRCWRWCLGGDACNKFCWFVVICVFVRSFLIFASLKMYNSLVERCFCHCVESFRRKTLDKQEETCVKRCAEKYLKHSMRVSMRFAELNQGSPTPD